MIHERQHLHTGRLERVAALHAGALLLFATWALGGNAGWAQTGLILLGVPAVGITAAALWERRDLGAGAFSNLWWLAPWLGFNLLVLASLATPNLRAVTIEAATVFFPLPEQPLLPSTARAQSSVRALLLFNALFLPAFNLALAVRTRTTLRRLLFLFAVNAVVLAVFGTLQKLLGAEGLYFGRVVSPNATFFATFIYHNHWGAFAVLALSAALGLLFHHASQPGYRDLVHSPAFTGIVAVLVLAATVPLSTSRSCTAWVVLLLAGALLHGVSKLVAPGPTGRRVQSRRWALGLVAVASVGVALIYVLTEPVFSRRVAQTRAQLQAFQATGSVGSRADLYADTWRMAQDHLLFGWGLGSYGTVFTLYNTQHSPDGLPQHYEDAHSDWLQSVAETGAVGTACRAFLVLLPLWALRRCRPLPVLSTYLLVGCALLVLYAWIEFPFGNAAVTLSFWVCFFAGVRLAQLQARDSHR